jgi:hypothetical protein
MLSEQREYNLLNAGGGPQTGRSDLQFYHVDQIQCPLLDQELIGKFLELLLAAQEVKRLLNQEKSSSGWHVAARLGLRQLAGAD